MFEVRFLGLNFIPGRLHFKDNAKRDKMLKTHYITRPSFEAICVFLGLTKNSDMEIQGRIKMIDETKTYGNNGFRKREVVITTEEQYPQHILVEFVQDKTNLLDNFQVGQMVKVSINLRGREWVNPQGETKYFNAIQGWRIESLEGQQNDENIPPAPPMEAFEPVEDLKEEEPDDLPF
tara:strand:- start:90 stop:623 length:534 start_codon:yes stop_codon:yes gene_type:complete